VHPHPVQPINHQAAGAAQPARWAFPQLQNHNRGNDKSEQYQASQDLTIRASGNSDDAARYYSRNANPATVAPQLQIACS
jgi:hypothetical protein